MEEIYYPRMNSASPSNNRRINQPQEDIFDFKASPSLSLTGPVSYSTSITPSLINSPTNDMELFNFIKQGFGKITTSMERLEQRITRMEQATSQILKNQQEVLQVPFMSQQDVDRARQVAEQLEQDSSVAKQLQAAYNKEVDVKKSTTYSIKLSECPICGLRVNQMDLEAHVEQCLEKFSNDPKKELQVQDTKKKVETGFFGRLFKTTTKTETTKVVSTQSPPESNNSNSNNSVQNMYPGYYASYPPNMNMNQQNGQNMPMMMPMYMYPNYPHHMTNQLE